MRLLAPVENANLYDLIHLLTKQTTKLTVVEMCRCANISFAIKMFLRSLKQQKKVQCVCIILHNICGWKAMKCAPDVDIENIQRMFLFALRLSVGNE